MLVFGYKQASCASEFTAEIFKLDFSYKPFNLCFMTSTDRSSKLKILGANVFPPAPPTHEDSVSFGGLNSPSCLTMDLARSRGEMRAGIQLAVDNI